MKKIMMKKIIKKTRIAPTPFHVFKKQKQDTKSQKIQRSREIMMAQPQQQQKLIKYGTEFKTVKEWKDFEKELKKQIAESQRKSKEAF